MLKQLVFWSMLVSAILNEPNRAFSHTAPQEAQTPLCVVKQFYKPYVTSSDPRYVPNALLVLANHGTPHLKWLIARDKSCENQTHEICWIDFDPIVGAQDEDFEGKYPAFSEKATRFGIRVTAKYSYAASAVGTDRTFEIYYDFIFDGKKYLLTDVSGNTPDGPYDLVQVLSAKL